MTETVFGRSQFEELVSKYFIPSQVQQIMLAYRLSKYGHRGQERDGGGRYFDHPREVSLVLLRQGVFDHTLIITALLHDVMEDSFILTWPDVEFIFGSRVCTLVKLVTKEPGLPKDQYFPRLLSGPPEAWLIKMADRLHNLETLDSCTPQKQLKQIKETREKYFPLCRKLAAEEHRYSHLADWFLQQFEQICQRYEAALISAN